MEKSYIHEIKRKKNKFTAVTTLKKLIAILIILSTMCSSSSSLAIHNEKVTMPIHIILTVNLYSPTTHKIVELPSLNYNNSSLEVPIAQKGDLIIVNSYAYGDVINTIPENNTLGIENVTVSISKIKNCGTVIEELINNQDFKKPNLNVIRIDDIEPGLYEIRINVTTIANGYSDTFFDSKEFNNNIVSYFSIDSPQELIKHSYSLYSINFFEHSDNALETLVTIPVFSKNSSEPDYIVPKESIFSFKLDNEKQITGVYFYWDNETDNLKQASENEYFHVPETFENNSTHIIHYAYLYNDGCISRYTDKKIFIK